MKLRVFDTPGRVDRYTVVYVEFDPGPHAYLCMSANPLLEGSMCYPGALTNEWLDKNAEFEITYQELPEPCRKYVEMELRQWPQTTQ